MAEELQSLLERIKKDGVDKAQAEAQRILDEARQKAAAIVAQAEKDAEARRTAAEQTAKAAAERGRKALEQAARDVILTIGETLNAVLREVIRRDVGQALQAEDIRGILLKAVEAYASGASQSDGIDILLSPDDQRKLAASVAARFAEEMKRGLEIRADGSIVRGFKVALKGKDVEHDFTRDAIVDALCQLVRPDLAAIVRSAGASR